MEDAMLVASLARTLAKARDPYRLTRRGQAEG